MAFDHSALARDFVRFVPPQADMVRLVLRVITPTRRDIG
jgi:hypothetical protein